MSNEATKPARDLIADSIERIEIIHARYTRGRDAVLSRISDNGGTRNGDVTEYWGEIRGKCWRVHLDHNEE